MLLALMVNKEWEFQFGQKGVTIPVPTIDNPTIKPVVKLVVDQRSNGLG
ncbi:MAG: hypothetical protein V3T40_02540 [Nitrososphaerales archaeon]